MQNSQERPLVFVGSSQESLDIARGIKAALETVAEVCVWNEDVFEPGQHPIDELLRLKSTIDFAVLVWTGDDAIRSRGQEATTPRDNVIFEAGFFYAALGRDRVFLVAALDQQPTLPSDLVGLTIVGYHRPANKNYRGAVSTPCQRIASVIERKGKRRDQPAPGTGAQPLSIYPKLEDSRDTIKAACRCATVIRILANKGLVFFGNDESIVSAAELADYPNLKRIQVILLGPESRGVHRFKLDLHRFESPLDIQNELRASHEIVESRMKSVRNQLQLRDSGVKYHHGEPYFRLLMTDTVAFASTYAEDPSVQVRDLPVQVFRREPGSLYHSLKRHFHDLWNNDIRSASRTQGSTEPEISAGGILITIEHERVFVALVKRDDGSWVIPKGHKEAADRNLEATATREVAEELGLKTSEIKIVRKLDEYTCDRTAAQFKRIKLVHLFLMRIEALRRPGLKSDPDHSAAEWWPLDERLPFMFYRQQRDLLVEIARKDYSTEVEIADAAW